MTATPSSPGLPRGRDFALSKIGQIGIAVADLARAISFYRDQLRLPLQFQTGQMAFFDAGGQRLLVGTAESGPEPTSVRQGTILYFSVPSVRAAYQALVERGVHFEREPHLVARLASGDLYMAFFRDPDGNLAAIMSEGE